MGVKRVYEVSEIDSIDIRPFKRVKTYHSFFARQVYSFAYYLDHIV